MSGRPTLTESEIIAKAGNESASSITAAQQQQPSPSSTFHYESINYDAVLFQFVFRITSSNTVAPVGYYPIGGGIEDEQQQEFWTGGSLIQPPPPPPPALTTTSGIAEGGALSPNFDEGGITTASSLSSSPTTPLPALAPGHHFGLTYSKRGDHFLLRTSGYPKVQENQPPSISYSSGSEVIPSRIALQPLPTDSSARRAEEKRKDGGEEAEDPTTNLVTTTTSTTGGGEDVDTQDHPQGGGTDGEAGVDENQEGSAEEGSGAGAGGGLRIGWNIAAIPKLMLQYFQSPMPRHIHIPWKIKLDKNESNPNLSVSLWFSMMTLQQAFERAGIVTPGTTTSPPFVVNYSLIKKEAKIKGNQ